MTILFLRPKHLPFEHVLRIETVGDQNLGPFGELETQSHKGRYFTFIIHEIDEVLPVILLYTLL